MMIAGKDILNRAHAGFIFGRRVRILAENLAQEIPIGAEILDVGTGDGSIAKAISLQRSDIKIEGIDVLIRPTTHIPVRLFDGQHIPLGENSVDVVSFVDVLHHTNDTRILLREAARVARHYILIKDHLREGLFAKVTLQTMERQIPATADVALRNRWWFALPALTLLLLTPTLFHGPPLLAWDTGQYYHYGAQLVGFATARITAMMERDAPGQSETTKELEPGNLDEGGRGAARYAIAERGRKTGAGPW